MPVQWPESYPQECKPGQYSESDSLEDFTRAGKMAGVDPAPDPVLKLQRNPVSSLPGSTEKVLHVRLGQNIIGKLS